VGKRRGPWRPTVAVVLLAGSLLAACGDDGSEAAGATPEEATFQTHTPGVLTVATELPNPPFVLAEDLDRLEGGYEVAMVSEIAQRLRIPRVEWVSFPFSELAAVTGAADARRLRFVVDAATKYPGLTVAGQFKTDEQYGAVLAKGSPNTRVLSEVIDQLRTDGVLDQLFQKYLPQQVNIPPLG
jgi:ABC-type amino acid transport substrate-binding protein